MIDVESQIYTPIAEALRAQFPGILVSGEYVNAEHPHGIMLLARMEDGSWGCVNPI